MLTANLINKNIPRLRLQDKVVKARQLILDYRVTHLAVVENGSYLGMISEEDLLDVQEENAIIENLQSSYIKAAVQDDVHFLNAVSTSIQFETNVVPVIKSNMEFAGVISTRDLLKKLGNFAGANEIGGIIVMEMKPYQFSISEISRIVESNDRHILHLNTTTDSITGLLTVTLHINHDEVATIVASLERYDYDVVYYKGSEHVDENLNSNYNNLMKYINFD